MNNLSSQANYPSHILISLLTDEPREEQNECDPFKGRGTNHIIPIFFVISCLFKLIRILYFKLPYKQGSSSYKSLQNALCCSPKKTRGIWTGMLFIRWAFFQPYFPAKAQLAFATLTFLISEPRRGLASDATRDEVTLSRQILAHKSWRVQQRNVSLRC